MKFAIYYAEREFANHHSDPRLALIDAPSREEAERLSSNLAPAVVAVTRPAREFVTRFDVRVQIQPKPALVRISPNSEVPILNR